MFYHAVFFARDWLVRAVMLHEGEYSINRRESEWKLPPEPLNHRGVRRVRCQTLIYQGINDKEAAMDVLPFIDRRNS